MTYVYFIEEHSLIHSHKTFVQVVQHMSCEVPGQIECAQFITIKGINCLITNITLLCDTLYNLIALLLQLSLFEF